MILCPGVWNENLVCETFSSGDAEAILSISLSVHSPSDRLVWNLDPQGVFSVKTAYGLEFSSQGKSYFTSGPTSQKFWKGLWHSKVPSSAKFLVWKLCHNILPTLDRLTSRQVVLESLTYPLCNIANESNVHLGLECCFTRIVLRSNPSLTQVCFTVEADSLGIKDWLGYCGAQLSSKSFECLIIFLWGIWKKRNCRVWRTNSHKLKM